MFIKVESEGKINIIWPLEQLYACTGIEVGLIVLL